MDTILEQKIVELIDNFQSAAAASGKAVSQALPQITEYAIRLKYWESLGYLAIGLILICLALLVFVFGFCRMLRIYRAVLARERSGDDTDWQIGCAFVGLLSAGLLIAGGILFLDPWNWCGVFEPKVALAHDIYVALKVKLGK